MMSIVLYLVLCSTVLGPIQGSRLGELEDVVKSLRSFVYNELSSIRHEVKEISNRVDILENTTVTHDTSNFYQDMDITSYNPGDKTGESGKQLVRAGNNEASHVVTTEVQNMRKAYANDKQDLHQLKQDVKGQLRELEQKITSHMHNLTADVQHNIEYIHENISLANVTLTEFINWSTTNINNFSHNIKMKINMLSANTSEQLAFRINQTETELKQSISSSYRQNEDNLERFMTLADRNVSEIILKANNLVSVIRSNFSEIPIQITNLSFEQQTTKNEIKVIDQRLGNTIASTANKLEKEIASLKICIYKEITHDGYYYPWEKNVRLANASFYGPIGVQGRLEVRHNNKWGTVCDDSFQNTHVDEFNVRNNINVLCRMFGFRECQYLENASLGKGSGDIWMDNVKCRGAERSFLQCPHNGWGVHNCDHGEDIGFRIWR